MVKYIYATLIHLLAFVPFSFCQQPADSIIKKLDSLSTKADSAGYQLNNISENAYNQVTKLSGRDYFLLLGSDIKQAFTKPFHMTGRDWKRFGVFAGVTVATGFADETIQTNALSWRNKNAGVRNTGNFISRFGGLYELYTLAGFGIYGIVFKNEKVKNTTLLATQACITGGLVEAFIKTLSGRTRPNFYGPLQEAEPTFKGPFGNTSKDANGKRSNSSFPSGHTTIAFAAATVFAKEYHNQPFIPIAAYTVATLIGASRITENKHWATDVLVGAALGFLTGKQVVNNYHRYAKIKATAKKSLPATFQLNYEFGRVMPGIVYKL